MKMTSIKIKNTKTHPTDKATIGGIVGWTLVTDAELVLVECDSSKEANFWIKLNGKFLKPILISRTEKIEVGDWYYFDGGEYKNLLQLEEPMTYTEERYKVLALPEHFSPQQLQDIVGGKLKEGKCLVECEELQFATVKENTSWIYKGHRFKINGVHLELNKWRPEDGKQFELCLIGTEFQKSHGYKYTYIYEKDLIIETESTQIKLNPHITIYPVEVNTEGIIVPNVFNEKNKILSRAMTFLSEEEGIGKEIFQELASLMDTVEEKMYTRDAIQLMIADFTEKCFDEGYVYKTRSALKNKIKEWFDEHII
jgi:hypothetical protein